MKKLFTVIAAVLILAPVALQAQRIVTVTRFEGERITGVEASSAFEVVLVKSIQTKAVVEINDIAESYLQLSRGSDGVVSVGLRDMGTRGWRELNRIPGRDKKIKLTLYLPDVNTIRLSGAVNLSSTDSFSGANVDIQLSGASEMKGFNIAGPRIKLQCSGASDVSIAVSTSDLIVLAAGASEVDVTGRGITYSKISASGASDVRITGDGGSGDWTASGASNIKGEGFAARDLSANASGASSIRVNVSGNLTTRTGGASSIRYAGNPARINNIDSSVKPL